MEPSTILILALTAGVETRTLFGSSASKDSSSPPGRLRISGLFMKLMRSFLMR